MITAPHRVRPAVSPEDQALIDRAVAERRVTIVAPGHALGLTRMEQVMGVAAAAPPTRQVTYARRRAAAKGAVASVLRRMGA